MRRLMRLLAIGLVLSVGGAGFSLWSAQTNLAAERAEARSLKKRTAQMSEALRAKRAQLTQTEGLQMPDPGGKGGIELTEDFNRLAHADGARVGAVHIMPEDISAAPIAANAPQAANPAGRATEAGAQKAASPMSKSRGTQAKFDYEFTGPFQALKALLHDVASIHRIIEISTVEMTQAQIGEPRVSATIRLRLSGTLYGLSETGAAQ